MTFTGEVTDLGHDLSWTTASEINNARFRIERAGDGQTFSEIGTITGNGTTASGATYTWRDDRPLAGPNYYRLQQEDYDGTTTTSPVIVLSNTTQPGHTDLLRQPVVDGTLTLNHRSATSGRTGASPPRPGQAHSPTMASPRQSG